MIAPGGEDNRPPSLAGGRLAHPFAVGLQAVASDAVQNQNDGSVGREVAAPGVVLTGLPPVQSGNAAVFALEELPPVAAFQHACSDRYPERNYNDEAKPRRQSMNGSRCGCA